MSSADGASVAAQDAIQAARDAIQAIENACSASAGLLEANQVDALPPRTIQRLVSTAVKLYIAKRESGCDFDPVEEGDLTATDVSETATGLLRAVRLEPFELGWWRRFGQL